MTDMLDNLNLIKEKDPHGGFEVVASQYQQAQFDATVQNGEHDQRVIANIVIAGMGGSALAALIAKVLLSKEITVPIEIVREYSLPNYVNENSLVIASSYSGNTEETIATFTQAKERGAQMGVLASGGALIDAAKNDGVAHVILPSGVQPRMATLYNLRALFALLENFSVISSEWNQEVASLGQWLESESAQWRPEVPTEENLAKQIALKTPGKIPVFYGGETTAPLAYKLKISWNETAKNVAFCNQLPEFNHNEFMGWTSHPVEKPFAVFDVKSSFENPRVLQRFDVSDRLLSGQRPHAETIQLKGDTLLAQLLWGAILSDFSSTYAAVLNGVDPVPVALIEDLKRELAENPVN
ncbi:bifunctional phosphoglucose/phosphomannose isomerase [Candidatus Saccharibacteria bacterium TM7i]|nr:bifunctional phosphoglucose/phosphomannose isomerase [Candidatus Saccharibacteria bacterium TM7i]